jgi:hypothetical protein
LSGRRGRAFSIDNRPLYRQHTFVPALKAEEVQRKFGTGKGKATLIDSRALDPMTDDEAEAFLQGRY